MATPTTTSNTAPDFITSFKQTFPEYSKMDNLTLSSKINSQLASPNSSKFISGLKERMPKIKDLPDSQISDGIKGHLDDMASKGQLSSGDQTKDLGLQTLAQKTGLDNNIISKGLKGVFDFFTSGLQKSGTLVGSSISAPENMQKYSDALDNYSKTTQNLTKQIQSDKLKGKDTSKLEKALELQKSSIPNISDFLDQTTIKRLNDSTGKNVEETLGTLGEGGLDALVLLPGGAVTKLADKATQGTTSLLSKIGAGAKIGAGYGLAGGLTSGLANKGSIGDVAKSTALGGLIGTGLGAGTGTITGAISNKLKTGTIMNLGKIPEKLTGDEGALANVPEAKDQILEAQKLTKDNIKNPDLPTASDVQGNKVHQDILTKSKTLLDSIGKKMETSLANPKVGGAEVDLSDVSKKFTENLKGRQEVSGYDTNLFNEFRNDLSNLSGGKATITSEKFGDVSVPGTGKNPKLTDVDAFLRKWQKIDASTQMKNNSVGALIDSIVHDINEVAKTSADKAETASGVSGHPYRESNDEYNKLINDYNDAKDELGTNRPSTGKYDNSSKVFRTNATANSSPAWKNLATATNTPLGRPASLTSLIEDIYHSAKPGDVIKNTRISYNPFLALARTALGVLGKAESDPDAIVSKMLQIIDEQQKGSTGLGGKIGGDVAGITGITTPKDVKVLSKTIVKGEENHLELNLSRPLTDTEMTKYLKDTQQQSIPQFIVKGGLKGKIKP